MSSNSLACSKLHSSFQVAEAFLIIIILVFSCLSLLWVALLFYLFCTTQIGKVVSFVLLRLPIQFREGIRRGGQNSLAIENKSFDDKSDRIESKSTLTSPHVLNLMDGDLVIPNFIEIQSGSEFPEKPQDIKGGDVVDNGDKNNLNETSSSPNYSFAATMFANEETINREITFF